MFFDVSNVGNRETVDDARASELMKPLLESTEMVSSICLSNKSYTQSSSAVIAGHLATVANAGRFAELTTVDIADVIAGRPEEEALEVLRTISSAFSAVKNLTAIDVSDNALGAKGLDACAALLEGQGQLTSLKACNNGISAASAKQLCDLVLASNCSLKRFHFYNNMSGPGGAKEIASMLRDDKLNQLTDLRFSGTRALAEGTLAAISAIAESNQRFVRLDLNDNTFKLPGAACIASAFMANKFCNLSTLLLRDGSLGAEGVTAIFKAMAKVKTPLVELDISGNEIGEAEGSDKRKAMKAVSKGLLSVKDTLKVFLLEDNELGSKSFSQISAAISACSNLNRLQLCNNEVRGAAILDFVKSCVAAQSSLLKTSGGLELDGNYLTEAQVESLQELLSGVDCEGCLGSLEDNNDDEDDEEEEEEDGDEDDEEDDEDDTISAAAADEGVAALASGLSSLSVEAAGSQDANSLKRTVGYLAVDSHVQSGMRVGLGTGSTATFVVERLAAKLKSGELKDCIGYPTSEKTLAQAQALGIPLGTLDDLKLGELLDVCIDGADSVDPSKQLVKGGGGALLREKMVAVASKKFVVVVDASKKCDFLGSHFMLPVEIVPFSFKRTCQLVGNLSTVLAAGGVPSLRMGSAGNNKVDGDKPAITDNGNYIVDIKFSGQVADPRALAAELSGVVGVVEHGLFIDLVSVVHVAENNGSVSTI